MLKFLIPDDMKCLNCDGCGSLFEAESVESWKKRMKASGLTTTAYYLSDKTQFLTREVSCKKCNGTGKKAIREAKK